MIICVLLYQSVLPRPLSNHRHLSTGDVCFGTYTYSLHFNDFCPSCLWSSLVCCFFTSAFSQRKHMSAVERAAQLRGTLHAKMNYKLKNLLGTILYKSCSNVKKIGRNEFIIHQYIKIEYFDMYNLSFKADHEFKN